MSDNDNMKDRLAKMRKERAAREKARIEMLRELNRKKYNKKVQPNNMQGTNFETGETHKAVKPSVPTTQNPLKSRVPTTDKVVKSSLPVIQNMVKSNVPITQKLVKANSVSQIKNVNAPLKNNFNDNTAKSFSDNTAKRPATAPTTALSKDVKKDFKSNEPKEAKTNYLQKNIAAFNIVDKGKIDKGVNKLDGADKKENQEPNKPKNEPKDPKKHTDKKIPVFSFIDKNKHAITNKINNDKLFNRKPAATTDNILAEIKPFKAIDPKLTRKSLAYPTSNIPAQSRKSMIPKIDTTKESVFERLYKPKFIQKKTIDEVEKLKTDLNYRKKIIQQSDQILQRFSSFEPKEVKPVRRSISAVHFKRIGKNEVANCIHKWSSIGDKLNNRHLAIDEGEALKEDKVISAVKSERKKVTFLTPKLNTPGQDELQARLKSWLQKRGKSLDAYQHLQCFGVHHLQKSNEAIPKFDAYDDENKENIALDSDSDDGSYTDNMGDQKDTLGGGDNVDKWRTNVSIQTEFNETADLNESTVTSADTFVTVDDLLIGALNDLTELLKEGYDPEHAVPYLRAIRSRFPEAPRVAAYWECRAALEERRGDLHASVQCWEEAIATGTEHNKVEANLDTLLNKFMQLNISPRAASKKPDPKLVDVKNVFKSALIRFAVTKAQLRKSEAPVYTVTPVRRSGRLSMCPTPRQATPRVTPARVTPRVTPRVTREPLQICESVVQASAIAPTHVFTVNEHLVLTP